MYAGLLHEYYIALLLGISYKWIDRSLQSFQWSQTRWRASREARGHNTDFFERERETPEIEKKGAEGSSTSIEGLRESVVERRDMWSKLLTGQEKNVRTCDWQEGKNICDKRCIEDQVELNFGETCLMCELKLDVCQTGGGSAAEPTPPGLSAASLLRML